MLLEKVLNKKIVERIERVEKEDSRAGMLLKECLWQEYLNRHKKQWRYRNWYLKKIAKRSTKEE